MKADKARDLIAQADRWRRRATACEDVQRCIRLGQYGRIFRVRRILGTSTERVLSPTATSAVYDALTIVKEQYEARAAEIEAKLGD